MEFTKMASYSNSLRDEMDAIVGLRTFDRIVIPPPPRMVQSGPMVFNNIRVENSTVGVINTGDVKSIDSVVSTAKTAGNEGLASALKDFTEAVLNTVDLQQDQKNEVVGQLAFLSQQAMAQQKQAPSVMRAIISGIERAINGSASLITLWPAP
jgi:hypothetical protein